MPTIDQITMRIVRSRLRRSGGNRTATARTLGISIRTLRNWISTKQELAEFRRRD